MEKINELNHVLTLGLFICFIFLTVLYYIRMKQKNKNIEQISKIANDQGAISRLYYRLISHIEDNDNLFEEIEQKAFKASYLAESMTRVFLQDFEKMTVGNLLCSIYEEGKNWRIVEEHLLRNMKIELANELYLTFTAKQLENLFKLNNWPEKQIKIAREIALKVLQKESQSEESLRLLSEVTEKLVAKMLYAGDKQKALFRAEAIKLEKGFIDLLD